MPKKREDLGKKVIVVGAGIAGCIFSFHLSVAGFEVEVFEAKKREELGHDWCDSIEKEAFHIAGISPPTAQERKPDRDHLALLSPDLQTVVHLDYYNYWIVDRKLLQKRLIDLAEREGVKFHFNTKVVEPIGKGMWVIGVKTADGKVHKAKLVVDCSGHERILASNIEVLDLNIPIKDQDKARAYRELHKIKQGATLQWGPYKIKDNILYYRYGYQGGYSWLNLEEKDILDVGAGTAIKEGYKHPKELVKNFIGSNEIIEKTRLRGGGGEIIVRRPITMVWYGFMAIGEAACQTIPTNGCGVGSAMIAAKIAAEVAIKALRVKEVSINRLWEYQVKFTQERGKHLAALDALRRGMTKLSEEEISLLFKRKILTKRDLEKMIHVEFPKPSLLKKLTLFFKGIRELRLLLHLDRTMRYAVRIYKHYSKIPKEYDTKKYHTWLLRQLQLFKELEGA